MKPCLYLLIPALFLVSCDQQEVDASRLVTRGEITYKVNSDTPFTGVSLTYHENGQLEERTTFQNGKQNSLSERYHENGQLAFIGNFKDGKQDGLAEQYYDNGQVVRRVTMQDGVIVDGIVEEYFSGGRMLSRKIYLDGESVGICFEPGCTDF